MLPRGIDAVASEAVSRPIWITVDTAAVFPGTGGSDTRAMYRVPWLDAWANTEGKASALRPRAMSALYSETVALQDEVQAAMKSFDSNNTQQRVKTDEGEIGTMGISDGGGGEAVEKYFRGMLNVKPGVFSLYRDGADGTDGSTMLRCPDGIGKMSAGGM